MERLIPFRPVPLNVVSELYRLSQCFFAPTEGMEKVKAESYDCQSCGACCAWGGSVWYESQLPEEFDDRGYVKRRKDGACIALVGEVFNACSCKVYTIRPEQCRGVRPGDRFCNRARNRARVIQLLNSRPDGLTITEIAECLGKSPSTVRRWLNSWRLLYIVTLIEGTRPAKWV